MCNHCIPETDRLHRCSGAFLRTSIYLQWVQAGTRVDRTSVVITSHGSNVRTGVPCRPVRVSDGRHQSDRMHVSDDYPFVHGPHAA